MSRGKKEIVTIAATKINSILDNGIHKNTIFIFRDTVGNRYVVALQVKLIC